MQIFILTHAEARDPAVLQNIQKFLEAQGNNSAQATHVRAPQGGPTAVLTPIGDDAPDVGVPDPAEIFGRNGDLAAQVFGANAVPPLPAGVHSTVDAEALPIAPVAPVTIAGVIAQTAQSQSVVAHAPVASAPLALATPTSHAAGAVTVDADGLPWDGRIHASTKGCNQDGRWKAKRNVDPALVAQVTAELRAAMGVIAPQSPATQVAQAPVVQAPALSTAIPMAPVTPSVPVVVPAPPVTLVATPEAALATSVTAVAPVTVPQVPVAPVAPTPAAVTATETFPQFMARMAPYTQQGLITPDMIAAVTQQLGLGLPMLQNRPDMIPTFAASLGMPATPQ